MFIGSNRASQGARVPPTDADETARGGTRVRAAARAGADDRGQLKELGVKAERSLLSMFKGFAARHAKPAAPVEPPLALVVDDEEPVRRFVERALQSGGYRTIGASDGPEAIEVAKKAGHFDILVTDVMMPEMNGDELARRLRQTADKMKVLYLTGFSDKLFKEKVTLWEDEAFLDKPCTIKGLLEAVSLLLHGSVNVAPAAAGRR
jgi:CheY-like chemotaxis protein